MMAAWCGKLHAVQWFLEKGATETSVDSNGWNVLHFSAQGSDPDTIDLIHVRCLKVMHYDIYPAEELLSLKFTSWTWSSCGVFAERND